MALLSFYIFSVHLVAYGDFEYNCVGFGALHVIFTADTTLHSLYENQKRKRNYAPFILPWHWNPPYVF